MNNHNSDIFARTRNVAIPAGQFDISALWFTIPAKPFQTTLAHFQDRKYTPQKVILGEITILLSFSSDQQLSFSLKL
jgi:hypothetical protein